MSVLMLEPKTALRVPSMTQDLSAGEALGTNAAPSMSPTTAPQGLWHGHIKAMPTVL